MKLAELTSSDLIILDQSYSTKAEVFDAVAERLIRAKIIPDKVDFEKALYEREKESPTGLENGIAIPHAKSSAINRPVFAVVRSKTTIDGWESLAPDNKVSLIFLLAIPEKNAGDFHVELLAKLSRAMLNNEFITSVKNATQVEEVISALERVDAAEKEKAATNEHSTSKKGLILGVTACPTGIAHTYMAAEAIEKTAKEMGYDVYVEKQGANGIEDRPSKDIVKKADGLIIAADVDLHEMSYYAGLPYISVSVSAPIKDAKPLITRVLDHPDGKFTVSKGDEEEVSNNKKKSIGTEMYQALMSGISYMIPIVVGAGLMSAIPQIGGLLYGLKPGTISNVVYATSSNPVLHFLYNFNSFGGFIFSLMYPVLAAFIAYAIAGKVGLAPGFIGGGLAGGLIYTVNGIKDHVSSGFLGAICVGFVAGYFCRFLNQKIKLSKNIQSLKPMLIIPLLSIILVYVLNLYIFEPIGGGLNKLLVDIIGQSTGLYFIAIVIAFATAFDMGGPFNKAAFAVTLALAADHTFPMTANILGCIIPPLGIGASVILNQHVFKRDIYDDSLVAAGYTSFISGIIGISEGAIPFALRDPLITIPLNMVGSAIAAVIATFFKVKIWFPIPQFWGWPLVEGLLPYLLSLLVGVLFVAIGNIMIRDHIAKRKIKAAKKQEVAV